MSRRLATLFYAGALALTPVSVACKFLLGTTDVTWIDPSLLLSLLALLALVPHWEDFLQDELRPLVAGAAVLTLASIAGAFSGMLLRPPSSLYTVLREPLRLWLNLGWLVASAWFIKYRPRVVLAGAIVAVMFGLGAGIYLELAAFHLAPAPALVAAYARAYLARQTLWFNGFPLLRMGSLFFEAPPFGLFMFSMFVVLRRLQGSVRARKWSTAGLFAAALGVLFSLSDQVLLAGAVGVFSGLPHMARRRPAVAWSLAILLTLLVFAFELQSFDVKQTSSNTGVVTRINGGSVGERSFHLQYGWSLLGAHPAASIFGIGPGRYGEYAADSGDFPDSVNMQTSEMEILVEWGVAGLALWIGLIGYLAFRIVQLHGVPGLGLLSALIIADSFQANWKHEAVFLAIAALSITPGARYELQP
jgi:hypothetical protein